MRSLLSCRFVFAMIAMLVFAVPVLAADPHGGEKGGLEFTGIRRWDLGIYTLIVFALMIFILSKYAWPHIKTGLEKREVNIRGALDEAKGVLAEAKREREAAQKQLAEAALQARTVVEEARRDGDELKSTKLEEGVKEVRAERDRARREIEAAKDAALSELYQQAVELATILSAKTLSRQISPEDHRRLIDESLADLRQKTRHA
jgi:F-type H+-transporting ATPase subunit b